MTICYSHWRFHAKPIDVKRLRAEFRGANAPMGQPHPSGHYFYQQILEIRLTEVSGGKLLAFNFHPDIII